jgi:replicative DNA helicase
MSKAELMSRSISRLTFENNGKKNDGKPKTTRYIMTGEKWDNYNNAELELIRESRNDYREYGKRIYIFEGMMNIGVEEIKAAVQKHITLTGRKPLVVVDYLQILAPYSDRMNDKQSTDKNVLELKRMSRDKDITVITVSSFNRDNYSTDANMASFKESGGIEFTADILLGLQYSAKLSAEDKDKKKNTKKITEMGEQDERAVMLRILKNRNGKKGKLYYDYYALFNYFEESDAPPLESELNAMR